MKRALSVILVLALFLTSASMAAPSAKAEITKYLIESEQYSHLGGAIKGSVKYNHEYDQGRPVKTTVASTGSGYPQKEILYAENGSIKNERILKDGAVILEQANNDAGNPVEIHFYGGMGTSTTYIFQTGDRVICEDLHLSEDPSSASYHYSILGTNCDIPLSPNQTAVFTYDENRNISQVDIYEGETRVHMYYYIYDIAGTSFQIYMTEEMEIEYTGNLVSTLKSREDLIVCSYTDGILDSVKYLSPYTQESKIEHNFIYLSDGYNLTDYFVQEGYFFTSISRHFTEDGHFERETVQLFGGLNTAKSCEYDANGNLSKYSTTFGGIEETHTFSYLPVTFAVDIPESERQPDTGTTETSPLQDVQVGDTLTFGSYRNRDSQAKEENPIEWLVLDIQDGKALLISRYALEELPYHGAAENTTWEACTLRRWLNTDFVNSAFSEEEQRRILTTRITTETSPYYDTPGGNDTEDEIFLFSASEAAKYFHSDSERICHYLEGYGGTSFDGNCRWWLRTPGYDQQCAAGVGTFGSIDYVGTYVNEEYRNFVRPAMWISISSQDGNGDGFAPEFFGEVIYLVQAATNTYDILEGFSNHYDKLLVWDTDSDSYYDESSDCWLWYNTNVTPNVWQYWYTEISSDYGDYGWMEYDNSNHFWYIETSSGNWSRVLPKYDTSNLWHIS